MIYSWFTHYKWWFSIVMLDCQRVYMFIRGILTFLGPISQLWLGSIWWIWARAWTTFSQHTHYTHINIYTYIVTHIHIVGHFHPKEDQVGKIILMEVTHQVTFKCLATSCILKKRLWNFLVFKRLPSIYILIYAYIWIYGCIASASK